MVNILLKCRNIEMSHLNKIGQSVFHLAAINNRTQIMKKLLSVYDHSMRPDNRGMLPIHYATLRGHYYIVDVLLKHTKSRLGQQTVASHVNTPQKENLTPVLYACHAANMHLLQLLLTNGGDIKATSRKGVTGLHLATATGNLSMVKHLIDEYDFDVNVATTESKSRPVHLAATGGHLQVLAHLLEERKCDPTETDKNHEDCLTLAIKHKQLKVADYLIKSERFDLTKVLAVKGFNYFAYALVKGQQRIAHKILSKLVQKG